MKKYDLWWYYRDEEVWVIVSVNSKNLYYTIEILKSQTKLTLKSKIKASIFKIAEHGDTSWMQHVPEYLLRKGE